MTSLRAACLWMLGAIVSFSAMAVAGRSLSHDLDTFEIMLYRSLIGIFIVLITSTLFATRSQIRAHRMGLHTLRNMAHFAGQNLWFYSLTVIPLAQVFALEFTSPIWALLLSVLILGERLTRARVIAAILGFIGILIVARPGVGALEFGVVTAALAAVGFAASAVLTRKLTRTESITSILFWLTVMQCVFGVICAGFDGDIAVPTLANWPWIIVIAFAGLVAHFCLTKALSLSPATIVMPIDFGRLPVIMVVGALLYSEAIDPYVILGALVIFGANYYNIWTEARAQKSARI